MTLVRHFLTSSILYISTKSVALENGKSEVCVCVCKREIRKRKREGVHVKEKRGEREREKPFECALENAETETDSKCVANSFMRRPPR